MKWVIYKNDELYGIHDMEIFDTKAEAEKAYNEKLGTKDLTLPFSVGTATGGFVGRSKLVFEREYGDIELYLNK